MQMKRLGFSSLKTEKIHYNLYQMGNSKILFNLLIINYIILRRHTFYYHNK